MSPGSRLSPQAAAFLIFTAFFLLTTLHFRRTNSWRDPSSIFFDPARAFARPYSSHRETLASAWISTYNTTSPLPPSISPPPKSSPNPTFCIGIPTIQRPGARYFSTLIGSLLSPLSPPQRAEIHLVPFIVSIDPSQHLAYSEPWLARLVDKVLTYQPTDPKIEVLKGLEKTDTWHKQKPILDYVKLMRECVDTTTAEYVVVLEDDVIASQEWYERMVEGVRVLEEKDKRDWLYLRLFYNERLLGWNGEEWKRYFWGCVAVWVGCAGLVWVGRRVAGRFFTVRTSVVVLFVCVPACMGLYFAAGRLTVAPLRKGVNRMDQYGCCSQAFLFPRGQIPGLVEYYGTQGEGFVDMFTEKYADEKSLERYAVTPSVFQHIGFKSSKSESPSRWGRSNTENIFNWSFEKNRIP